MNDTISKMKSLKDSGKILGYIVGEIELGNKVEKIEEHFDVVDIKGSVSSKSNQAEYIQPTQRLLKAFIDRDISTEGNYAMAILGPQGSQNKKYTLFARRKSGKPFLYFMIIISDGLTSHEIVTLLLQYKMGKDISTDFDEPNIDYIETIRSDIANGDITEGLVVDIPTQKLVPRTWLREAVKKSEDDDESQVRTENLKHSPIFGLLFTESLTSVVGERHSKELVAACLLMKSNRTEIILWNRPNGVAFFGVYAHNRIEKLSSALLLPLWAKSSEEIPSQAIEPKVVVRKEREKEKQAVYTESPALEEKITSIQKIMKEVDILGLLDRLERLENLVLSKSSYQTHHDRTRSSQIDVRIRNVTQRLEDLVRRLEGIENDMKRVLGEE